MFKVTNIVMLYAPIGVGAAIAYTIGPSGLGVLWNLAYLVFTLYVALAFFAAVVLVPVMLMLRIPIVAVPQGDQGAGADRLLDHLERSGAAAGHGMRRGLRRAAADRVVRPAARLQLQPRRQHALPVAGGGVRRPGGRRRAHRRPADHHAAHADADEQGRGRRAAGLAGDPGGDAGQLQPAARGRHADPRRRRHHGHGAAR